MKMFAFIKRKYTLSKMAKQISDRETFGGSVGNCKTDIQFGPHTIIL